MSYSGYGDWNSGTNRGYEGYNYGYGYGQDNSGSYGYGMATSNSWEMANSDVDMNPDASGGGNADAVIAKMNQRLDMVSHLDTDTMQGGHYSSGGDRYDSYESYDSRSSLNERDLYRSGYDYGEAEHDNDNAYEGHYDNFYGNRRDQYQNRARDNFGQRGQNWARDGRNNRPMASSYSGRMGGQWNEPPQSMGARGLGPHGSSRLPSLFSHNIIPELSMFQGMRGFSGNMRFGGGMMKQRMRRNWKMWDSDFKLQKKKIKKDPTAKKRKQTNSSDEPDSKAAKTDGSDNSDSDNEEGTEGESGEKEEKEGSRGEGEDEEGKDSEKGALTIQEEISQIKRKLQAGKKTQERQKKRHRDRMVERIQFVCSLCKYRTFYDDEMNSHLESKFHKEHFKFVGTKLPQQTADFLQEYVANKTRKTEERRKAIEDINAVIQQIYRDQDLTQDVGMEHFIKKVEAAHCAACDLFIPMQYGIIQKHLKSLDHNHNRLPCWRGCAAAMAQSGPSVTLSLTLPITCHICLGKVRHPVICVNNHVFCSICIDVWLKNNNQCPACRIPITPENPCKEIIGGTSESDPVFSPTVRKHLRKTRIELLHKEYEDEIESLQKEVEDLRGKNLGLQTQLKSLLDPTMSALSCQSEETSQSTDEASTTGPETLEEWSKKLKAANDICEKVIDNVEKLKEANKKLSMENNSLLRENLRLKAEVDSRSPQKFGRFTVAALQSKVEQSEREMNRLKKALERSDKYIEEMECQLLQLKSAGEGTQTVSTVSEGALSTDAKETESIEEDTTHLKSQVECLEKKALTTSQSPESLEQLTGGGTCSSSSSQDGSNGSNTQCAPKKELFPGCQGVLLDEGTTNMDACLEQEWNKIEECTPFKDEELYELPAPCTPFLSLSRLQLNTPDGKESTRKPSSFLRKLKFEEFCDTSDDCSKDSPEHSTSSCNSEKKLNCFTTGKSGFWGTCPSNFAENLDFDESEQNTVASQSDETPAKSSDKTSSSLPKKLHTLCSSEMNRTRTSSEASMDAAYLDKISELDSMMSESDNSKSPCYNFKSSDLDNSSKSTECSKLLNETEKKLEDMDEEQSMKCPEASDPSVDRTGWKPAMFSLLSPSELDMNDHFPLFAGQNIAASEIKPPNCLFQREFSQSLLFSNSQRLFEEQKFGSCFLKMSSDLHNQLNTPWVSPFIPERKNKNTGQSTKRKIQSGLSSASPSKTTKN